MNRTHASMLLPPLGACACRLDRICQEELRKWPCLIAAPRVRESPCTHAHAVHMPMPASRPRPRRMDALPFVCASVHVPHCWVQWTHTHKASHCTQCMEGAHTHSAPNVLTAPSIIARIVCHAEWLVPNRPHSVVPQQPMPDVRQRIHADNGQALRPRLLLRKLSERGQPGDL